MQRSPRILRIAATASAVAATIALASPVASGVATMADAAPPPLSWTSADDVSVEPAGDAREVHAREGQSRAHQAREAAPPQGERRRDRGGLRRGRSLVVRIPEGGIVARKRPSADAPSVGRVVDRSRYYGVPVTAWVEEVSRDGAWGRIELPYVWPRRNGWVRLDGLSTAVTRLKVVVDRSGHRLTLRKDGEVVYRTAVATGRPSSPTPLGEYFVTDRVAFGGGTYGSFAFGISGIQPRLPPGWTSGDQLAIHGTSSPETIGTSASAGCLRASEAALARLKPVLELGTPVVVRR